VNRGAIFTVRPDGSGRTLYASSEDPSLRFYGRLSWAPDASRIAAEAGSAIWLVSDSSEGWSGSSLTGDAFLEARAPSWSSDGQWLTFLGFLSPGDWKSADIYAIKSDGSGLARITNDPTADFNPDLSRAP
jgi:Tol biopolymer transport system component